MSKRYSLLDRWRLALLITADSKLSSSDKAVALQLLDMCNGDGVAWPSLPTLAGRTSQTQRNVIRCIERLVEAEYFTAQLSRGRGRANVYRPAWERAEKVTATSPFEEENVTAPSRFEEEKVTSASPFDAENVTAPSVKGDSAVIENVTALSPQPAYRNLPKEPESSELPLGAPSGFGDEEAGEEEEVDFASLVWSEGRAFLASRGVKPSQIGGLIGLWRKTLQDDEKLLELIGRAVAENIDHPVPWMQAAIRRELASPRKAPAQEFRGGLDPEERARRFVKFEVISSTDPIEVREAWRRRAYPIPEWVEEEERRRAEAAGDDR